PAGIAAFDDMDEALEVAVVAVVVAGEQVAVFVEGEFLRVAQTVGDEFEFGAVGIAAEDRAFIEQFDVGAVAGGGVGGAIADGEIQFAVGAEDEAVQIVAGITKTDTEAADQFVAGGCDGAVVGGIELPDAGNIGEPDLALTREHAGGDAVELGVKTVGKHAAGVGHAVAVGVLHETHDFGFDGEFAGLVAEDLVDQFFAVFDRTAGQ